MESEKVKVIKACLDREVKDYQSEFSGMCLAYINELESENERLKTSEFNSCQELDNAFSQIHSLEDRIYELEYGIAKSMLGCEFLPECTDEKLKQFAKLLLEKHSYDKLTHEPDEDIEIHLTASELYETVNEFLKGENNE